MEPVSYAAVEEDCIYSGLVIEVFDDSDKVVSQLVSWCFEPSQLQRITSGLNTNFTLSPDGSLHKSSYHKSCFFSLFIFRGHSAREPASSRVTYSFLRAYTGTSVSHSQHTKKSREVLEKMQVNGPEGYK